MLVESATCAVEGCDRKLRARGWCGKHYQRWTKHGDPATVMPHRHYTKPRTPEHEKFWDKVAVLGPDDCWEWTGCRTLRGYGQLGVWRVGRWRTVYAHRLAYELEHGAPVPSDMTIDHLCNNPPCVNPAHLAVATQAKNTLRGDSPPSRNARKTHCAYGHEFNAENTHICKDGARHCRVCDRIRKRAKHLSRGTARTRRKPA